MDYGVGLNSRLFNKDAESAEVLDCGSLFHSGTVLLAAKSGCFSVVVHRGTWSLSSVARPRVALGFLSRSSSVIGTATSPLMILYM